MNKIASPAAIAATSGPGAAAQPDRNLERKNADSIAADTDAAALKLFGAAARGLLPDEADAWTSLVSATAVNEAIRANRELIVVDVRAADDFARGHIPGAVNLTREAWPSAAGLSKEKVNVVYCYSHTCPLGGEACAKLAEQGYPVVEMDGGFEVWQSSELEVER